MSNDTTMGEQIAEPVDQLELDDPNVRITILQYKSQQSDPYSMSFQIDNEDHTLGNALRYIIMKNPQVEFCGYSIPHPSEAKMNVRIQTYGKVTAIEALKKGLTDLVDLCDVVMHKFSVESANFGKHEPTLEEE
ncbi:putative DNA-directed RNA polymerase subunit [Peziza echinospora]|nr:putative DNA-directed RNA polymerase subunit [Peziza echinospora]